MTRPLSRAFSFFSGKDRDYTKNFSAQMTKHDRNLCSLSDWLILSREIRTEKQPDQTQISVRHYLGKLRHPSSGGMTTERRLFTKQNNFLYNCNGHFCHLRRHILAGRSLHLIDVHLNDSGVYQCDAVNEHGMIISSTWINVAGNQERRSMCK